MSGPYTFLKTNNQIFVCKLDQDLCFKLQLVFPIHRTLACYFTFNFVALYSQIINSHSIDIPHHSSVPKHHNAPSLLPDVNTAVTAVSTDISAVVCDANTVGWANIFETHTCSDAIINVVINTAQPVTQVLTEPSVQTLVQLWVQLLVHILAQPLVHWFSVCNWSLTRVYTDMYTALVLCSWESLVSLLASHVLTVLSLAMLTCVRPHCQQCWRAWLHHYLHMRWQHYYRMHRHMLGLTITFMVTRDCSIAFTYTSGLVSICAVLNHKSSVWFSVEMHVRTVHKWVGICWCNDLFWSIGSKFEEAQPVWTPRVAKLSK